MATEAQRILLQALNAYSEKLEEDIAKTKKLNEEEVFSEEETNEILARMQGELDIINTWIEEVKLFRGWNP
jgi:hypothetical protein